MIETKSPSPDWSRRIFLERASAMGAAALLGHQRQAIAEAPPEITRIRLEETPAICVAPDFVAEPLLKAEGFTDVQYVKFENTPGARTIASGVLDMTSTAAGDVLMRIDAGEPIVALSGLHLGCYELFAEEGVRSIRELKGKTIAIDGVGGPQHVFLASMAAYVGLDPRVDINWIVRSSAESMELLAEGKVAAFLGFPPEPQELRARNIRHVIVNTAVDKPWSQYYCCMLISNRDFIDKYPIATKRAVRAILKAADLCVQQPEQAARMMVDRGFTKTYAYALETLKEVSYRAWRTYDPESTLRFHALRLHEAGMIKSTPQKLIAHGTDWRFLNELRRELKV